MDYQEILEPVAQYRDHLRSEHAENTRQEFEELLQKSGVDEKLNAEKVKNIQNNACNFFHFVILLMCQ